MILQRLAFALFSVALALFANVALAQADVRYIVSGVFDDQTTLAGSFDLNPYGYVSNYDLTTAAGTLGGHHYVDVVNVMTPQPPPFLWLDFLPGSQAGGLTLTFDRALQGYGTFALSVGEGGASWENQSYTPGGTPIRYLLSGSAVATPEPGTWALMLIGFAGLGLARYRAGRLTSACATSSRRD